MSRAVEGGSAKPVFLTGTGTGVFDGDSGTLPTNAPITAVGNHITNSSLSTAVTLTPQTNTNWLMIGIEDQPIRLRMDGVAATAANGFLFAAGDVMVIQFKAGTSFSVIETAASAVIQYQWGRV